MSKDVLDLPPESLARNRRIEANDGFHGRGRVTPPEFAFESTLGASPYERKYGGDHEVPYWKR